MLSPAEAEAAIRASVPTLEAESRTLPGLNGAVLRESITATRDQPPFDRVTMDGIAFASGSNRREFRVAGTQAAGTRQMVLADTDACFEVMTGAVVPQGCDCVMPIEKLSIANGIARLGDDAVVTPGMNIHTRGLDCRAGTPLLESGRRIGPPEVAIVASAGLARAQVSRAPRIMVISTGDELIEPGEPVADWQIYRSNAYAVLAALQQRSHLHLAHDHLPDDADVLRSRLRSHLDTHDVLILSGGVSMGKFDYVPQTLGELGVRVVFHKVAQRPGKPMWFGLGPQGQTVYALPGNPVSTLVCLARYVYPGLAAATGESPVAGQVTTLAEPFEVKAALALFLPVKLVADASGSTTAQPRPTRGSGDFTSLLGTDGFVELPPGPVTVPRGAVVPLYRW
ncbi:MAG TPA: molybdopterin molybdotransferase MoeA [Povalibacter sp.]